MAMTLVMLRAVASGSLQWWSLPLNVVLMGAVPVAVSWAILRAVGALAPPHPFVYLFVVAFFGAAAAMLATGLAASLLLGAAGVYSFEYLGSEYVPWFLLMAWAEAFTHRRRDDADGGVPGRSGWLPSMMPATCAIAESTTALTTKVDFRRVPGLVARHRHLQQLPQQRQRDGTAGLERVAIERIEHGQQPAQVAAAVSATGTARPPAATRTRGCARGPAGPAPFRRHPADAAETRARHPGAYARPRAQSGRPARWRRSVRSRSPFGAERLNIVNSAACPADDRACTSSIASQAGACVQSPAASSSWAATKRISSPCDCASAATLHRRCVFPEPGGPHRYKAGSPRPPSQPRSARNSSVLRPGAKLSRVGAGTGARSRRSCRMCVKVRRSARPGSRRPAGRHTAHADRLE